MEEIAFEVRGSAPEPYVIVFVRRSQTNISAYCSCPAGEQGQYCKHRFAILDGIATGVVSLNVADIGIVQSWLTGTDVERALLNVRSLEKDAVRIKKELSSAKKELARAMRD